MGSSRIAQGDQLGALCPPRGVGGRHKREEIWGYMYMYSWFTLLYSRNQHTIVKQLYSNKDVKKKKKKQCPPCQQLQLSRLVREAAYGFIIREWRELVARTVCYSLWWLHPNVATLTELGNREKMSPFSLWDEQMSLSMTSFASPEIWMQWL